MMYQENKVDTYFLVHFLVHIHLLGRIPFARWFLN